MQKPPKVSVCLPVYNGERFLAEAIQSVLKQSFKDFELLIIDDCSHDRSQEIIKDFAASDKRIRFLQNSKNLGLFNNYNECLKMADGQYIKLFAQDDVFHHNIIEEMVNVMENNPQVALVSCTKGWISETDEKLEPTNAAELGILKPFDKDTYKSANEMVLDSFQRFINCLGEPCTVMFRSIHKDSGFDTRFKQIGDLEYWYRILQHGDYYFLSAELCKFRKHQDSATNRNSRSLSALLDWFVLGSKHRHLIAQLNETEAEFCARLTRRLIKTISTRFAAYTENTKIDPGKVLEQLTSFTDVLSCFSPTANRCEADEYKVFAICALKEGANLLNEVRLVQNQVEFKESQIDDLKSELKEVKSALQNEIAELKAALFEMGNSASWKATAPLRTVKKLLP